MREPRHRLERIVVESRFDAPLADAQLAAEHGARACLAVRRVRLIARHISADRRHMISVFEAPDAEAVRQVIEAAGIGALGEIRVRKG